MDLKFSQFIFDVDILQILAKTSTFMYDLNIVIEFAYFTKRSPPCGWLRKTKICCAIWLNDPGNVDKWIQTKIHNLIAIYIHHRYIKVKIIPRKILDLVTSSGFICCFCLILFACSFCFCFYFCIWLRVKSSLRRPVALYMAKAFLILFRESILN